jgi:hypothetical protein
MDPLCFGVASFFLGGLCFEPRNEACNNAPSFVSLAYLAYQLLSNTELALLAISTMIINVLGSEAYIMLRSYMGSALLKTSCPHGHPL